MRDSGVYVEEGIGIYFGVILSGKSMPCVRCWRGVKKLFVDRLREKKEWEYWLPIGSGLLDDLVGLLI